VREGVSRHAFRGGNVFMLELLDRHRDELNVSVPSEELQRSAAATLEHLQRSAAGIEITSAERVDTQLLVGVRVRNRAGATIATLRRDSDGSIHRE